MVIEESEVRKVSEKVELKNLFEELNFVEERKESVREIVERVLIEESENGYMVSVREIVNRVREKGYKSEMRVRKVLKEIFEDVIIERGEKSYLVMRKMRRGKFYYWVVDISDKKNDVNIEEWRRSRKKVSEDKVKIE